MNWLQQQRLQIARVGFLIGVGVGTAYLSQQEPRQPNPHQARNARQLQQPQESSGRLMAQPLQQDNTGPFMRAKLSGCQQVLDGIVAENYLAIERGAKQMKVISETVRWPKAEDAVYQHHGKEFRNQCDEIVSLAKAQDLTGVHYAFLHLQTTCLNCHRHVRQYFKVEPAKDPKSPVRLIPGYWEGDTFRPDRTGERLPSLRR